MTWLGAASRGPALRVSRLATARRMTGLDIPTKRMETMIALSARCPGDDRFKITLEFDGAIGDAIGRALEVAPASTRRRTIASRPVGVKGAFS